MTRSAFEAGDAVVVTGAAQGIGRGIALRLARMKARLALWDIAEDGLASTAELCREAGAEALTSIVDIGSEEDVAAGAGAALAKYGAVFGLVNNAGIFPRASVLESTVALWERVLRVNLIGGYLCVKALCPAMLASGRGAVVNIASSTALRGHPRGAHYAASKAGVVSFTKTLSLELAPSVRVNCVIPGLSETAQPLAERTLEELRDAGKTIPLQRIGQPEDVAGVVAFLLGADASYLTGQSIAVTGGASMIP